MQFKRPISEFGLIRQKIATSAQLIYAGESMAYRTAGLVDAATAKLDKSDPEYFKKAINIIEEYTIEASILKVFCSDALAFDVLVSPGAGPWRAHWPALIAPFVGIGLFALHQSLRLRARRSGA